MLADLHSHTWLSDGALAPQALIQRALDNQVTHLAITDHDTTDALDHIEACPQPEQLTLIPGVEISCLWEQREIHVVGLGFDRHDATLQGLLQRQQQLRWQRAQDMDLQLQKAGITGLTRYLETLPCKAVSRNHVADFLIERGVARSKSHAFKNHLGDRGRFRVVAQWCEIEEAVAAIQQAGGLAILAHPNRYNVGNAKLRRLVQAFAATKGQGIEVSYSNIDPNVMGHMASLCIDNGLWASTGSDFHTPTQQWMDVGRFRRLPAQCADRAIWMHPDWPACIVAGSQLRATAQ